MSARAAPRAAASPSPASPTPALPSRASRAAWIGLAVAVLVLDLWSKHWAMVSLANAVHPMVVRRADAGLVSAEAAFAARGVEAEELRDAAGDGALARYTQATGLRAESVLTEADADLDLVLVDGTGLPPPRRIRLYQGDIGRSLEAVVAQQARLEPGAVQAVLDQHAYVSAGRVTDTAVALPEHDLVVLRERSIVVIPGFARFVYAENFGAAWGFLQNAPPILRHLLFVTISLVASVVMAWVLWKGRMATTWSALALAGILGGAVGNLVDRVRYRAVIDFVYNYVTIDGKVHGWPVYNVADIGITVGVVLIALEMLFVRQPVPDSRDPSTDPPAAPAGDKA